MKIVKKFQHYIKTKKSLVDKYADPKTIFIYQMGKVGSTSLEHSISEAIHIHAFFHQNHICPPRFKGLAKFGWRYFIHRTEQEILAAVLRWTFKRRKHTKVITLVREPLSRNISMFFHDLDAYLFAAHTNCLNTRKKPLATRNQPKNLLKQVYNEEFNHLYAVNWFDNEFKPMTGIDIYTQPFNKEQGYSEIISTKMSVLCLRTDMIDTSTAILEQFIGQKLIIAKNNRAKDKWYSDIYNNFKLEYELPQEIENQIKKSKFFKHFFN